MSFDSTLGNIGGIIGGIFGGGSSQDPYAAASGYYQQAQDYLKNLMNKAASGYDPYSKAGLAGLGAYQAGLGQLADPQAYYNQVMKGYQESPTAKFNIANATNAANAQAAASGLTGSSNNLDDVARITQGLQNQDEQQYYNNISGLMNKYLSGESGLANMGMGAQNALSGIYSNFGQDIAGLYGNEAQAAYGSAQNRQNQNAGIGGLIGTLAGFL